MPLPIQIISNFIPAKYFIILLRDILIKGVSPEVYGTQILYLMGFAVIFILLAARRIRKSNKV